MSTQRGQLVMLPARRTESVQRAAQHLRLWLAAVGVTYDRPAREAFVRAHPTLFGRAYEVTLRGFERWQVRHQVSDTVDGFAHYIASRHERWLRLARDAPAQQRRLRRTE